MNIREGALLYIDKPYGMSSFQALARVRGMLSRRAGRRRIKIGHAGTLDPLATGVLIMCTGRKTREIERLQCGTKEYEATLQLGATTASYDREQPVDATYPTSHITRSLVEEVLRRFEGEVEQVPPAYSACKVGGKRAYQMARSGKDVVLRPKRVLIERIELTGFDLEAMTVGMRVVCGKGTYIRALARDIGRALGSGAYLTSLRRTRVGDVGIADCTPLGDFSRWLDGQAIEDSFEEDREEKRKAQ